MKEISVDLEKNKAVMKADCDVVITVCFDEHLRPSYVDVLSDDYEIEFEAQAHDMLHAMFLRVDHEFMSLSHIKLELEIEYNNAHREARIDAQQQARHEQSFRDPKLYL
jgi:hypothetical protein